jgi:hypothetical protein
MVCEMAFTSAMAGCADRAEARLSGGTSAFTKSPGTLPKLSRRARSACWNCRLSTKMENFEADNATAHVHRSKTIMACWSIFPSPLSSHLRANGAYRNQPRPR